MYSPIQCFIQFLIIILLFSFRVQAQSANTTIHMVKGTENNQRIIVIDDDSRFKLQLYNGQKIKGKVQSFNGNFFISVKGDTIFYHQIDWIKLQRELTNFQEIAAVAAFVIGSYLSFATIPAAMYFIAMQSQYLIILAPIASISTAVIGFKLLTGRRYHLDKWKIEMVPLPMKEVNDHQL